ncbi:Consortin [Microtus ochrogaster]|uniref:Consortin n=1 Tax=Microtus ochrogaster TaxID=79684 RepID=A0A8J6GNN8_MICOH|nr:Consortin [Microtus ochrogaster]
MDDSDTPASSLQIGPQDGCHPGGSVERRVTPLPSVADENENQLDGDGPAALTGSGSTMGRATVFDQDSLNNNESCLSGCEVAPSETAEHSPYEGPKDDQSSLAQDKQTPGKRSPRAKRGTPKNGPPVGAAVPLMQTVNAELQADAEEAAGVNANEPPKAPAPALQPLFSLIRGEVEQMDSRALPLFLHQFFYSDEKAMKLIQLERLYHEQLLANLSAIQEQWEIEAGPAMEPSGGQHEEQPQESNPGSHQMDWQAASPDLPVTAGKDHTKGEEEPLRSNNASLELHTRSPETAGSRSGPDATENGSEGDGGLQTPPTEDHPDVSEEPKVSPPSESVTEQQLFASGDALPPVLISESEYSQAHRKELCLPVRGVFEALPREQLQSGELDESRRPAIDGKSPQSQTDLEPGSENALCGDSEASDVSVPRPEVCMTPEEGRDKEDQVSKETEDYLHSLLEGCLKDAEESLSYEDTQDDDSDLLQDLSPEEASYSLQESLPPDESSLSLDDLAKKIEIAEAVPAEGLVSILKKRNDTVGDHPAQMQQKPAKRRVRFQEIDDNLDQDEVGSGSCILLILLCIATVFLSVGGTALYCTLGNMESPVCTDFADNMDFYYTKLLQGAVPAEGLVSILKKRNDTVGDHPAQMQQKPAKRRVRFQEIDDNLDQEEVGSGSCILLILLCIATVFLSVGGTALYCTLGNMESPVCTDFADNMDFYYTKLLQGVAGLKHWVYLS